MKVLKYNILQSFIFQNIINKYKKNLNSFLKNILFVPILLKENQVLLLK